MKDTSLSSISLISLTLNNISNLNRNSLLQKKKIVATRYIEFRSLI